MTPARITLSGLFGLSSQRSQESGQDVARKPETRIATCGKSEKFLWPVSRRSDPITNH